MRGGSNESREQNNAVSERRRKRKREEERDEMVGGSVSPRTVRAAFCVCVCLYFTDLAGRQEERESHCIEKRKTEEKEAHHGGP